MSIRNKILTMVLGLSLVVAMIPGVASAALTSSQVSAIISLLQSFGADATTIANVQASLTGGTPTTPATPGTYTGIPAGFTFNTNIPLGTVDQDVVYLKAVLIGEGCGDGISNTTYYGPKTKANVVCFQNKYKSQISAFAGYTIAASGLVGTGTRAQLNVLLGTTPTTPGVIIPTGAGLTVALSSDNPASGTIVAAQGLATLAKFTFVNGDNAEVKVTNLKVNRTGLSADASLVNVYLLQGATRLTDAASVSSSVVTFNDSTGLFTVPAGGSATITVASDICNTTTCTTIVGQTVGISVATASNVTTNASSVKGTFPVSGNLMTVGNASLAGVSLAATTTPSANSSLTPQNDYVVWQNSTVVSTRAVNFTRIAFREIGTIAKTDLQNFRLLVDGVQVGSSVTNLDVNGYVTFDLSAAPKRLEAGTRVIKLMADIIGGSSRTFYFSVRVAADTNFVDTQYNVNVAPVTATTGTSFTLSDVTAGTQTVASGTLTIAKTTDSPSGNVVNNASNALLAKYTLTAAGERVKIESLNIRAFFTNTIATGDDYIGTSTAAAVTEFKLRNGALYANGVQIGSTTSISPVVAGTAFNFGSSLIVVPGSPVTLEVRADIYDDTGTLGNDIDATDTIKARIAVGSSNAQGQVSLATISTPSAVTDGNTLTVAAGGLTLAKYTAYTNHNIVAPVTAYKIAEFSLTANTNEAVNVSTIEVDLNDVSAWTSNLYVDFGGTLTSIKAIGAATNTWSVNNTLTAGQTVSVKVYGDISSSMPTTGGKTAIASVLVSGTTAGSATAVTGPANGTALDGQTLTNATGTFAKAIDGTTPEAQIVAGGQTITSAKYKFTATNDSATINEVKVTVTSQAISAIITKAQLVDPSLPAGSQVLKEASFDTTTSVANDTAYFTGLSVLVPANTSKSLSVNLVLGIPSATASTRGLNVATTLEAVKWSTSQGTPTTDSSLAVAGNAIYVYKSIPTIATASLPAGQGANLASGSTTTLFALTIKADAKGDIAIKQLKFPVTITEITTTANGALTLGTFKFFRGSTDLTSLSSGVDIQGGVSGETMESTYSIGEGTSTIVVTFLTEEVIPAGSTYTYSLKATPSGFASTTEGNDLVSTVLSTDAVDTNTFINDAANEGIFGTATTVSGAETAANVLWSDMSAVGHSYTDGSASNDWTNGYLVNNLSLDARGVSTSTQ